MNSYKNESGFCLYTYQILFSVIMAVLFSSLIVYIQMKNESALDNFISKNNCALVNKNNIFNGYSDDSLLILPTQINNANSGILFTESSIRLKKIFVCDVKRLYSNKL